MNILNKIDEKNCGKLEKVLLGLGSGDFKVD
jgi:hypothetical protein